MSGKTFFELNPCSRSATLAERLAYYSRPTSNGCREWVGYKNELGYGWVRWQGKRRIKASRLALELKLGRPLQPGMQACHHCDNPPCIEPSHLFEGTQRQNSQDASHKGRIRTSPKSGESNPAAKLRLDQVEAIRKDSRRQVDIAAAFGVSQAHVSSIKRRASWPGC